MTTTFNQIVEEVIGIEGGFSDNSYDSGGKTKYGITESVAREHGYIGDMKLMTKETAKQIYKKSFWDKNNLDEILSLSVGVAKEMFDTGVNCGVGTAGMYLQKCLNALNVRATIYPDIVEDGIVGSNTVGTLIRYLDYRKDDLVLIRMLNCIQGYEYVELSRRREKDETFIYGWFKHRVVIK